MNIKAVKAVLFDLDGTLLPMDEEVFTKGYFKLLAKKLAPLGYKPDELFNAIWAGIKEMINSDGTKQNVDMFWEKFAEIFGDKVYADMPHFDEFYRHEFQQTIAFCSPNPLAKEVVELSKERGFRVAVATNPVFPAIATESRIRFAGLLPEDFELYTTYENSRYCKPNLNYYKEILNKLDCKPEECVMIGNNVSEDMVAEQLGMKVFLLTDCLVNKNNVDITHYAQGNFQDLINFIKSL